MKALQTPSKQHQLLANKQPYLLAAQKELEKQLELLVQYVGLRRLQLKAIGHQKELATPDPLWNHLEEYDQIESKWLSQLHFFYARQQEWEQYCSPERVRSALASQEQEKATLLQQLKQLTILLTTALKEVSLHYQTIAQKIQRNRPFHANRSFYRETATFLDIQG